MTNTNLSVATLREAIQIQEQIEKLQSRLSKIIGGGAAAASTAASNKQPTVQKRGPKRGGMSAAGRARISAAAKARWAKIKRGKAGKAVKSSAKVEAKA